MKSTKKKLAVIGTVGVPAKYGGFETLVHYMVENLNERFDMTVYCSSVAYKREDQMANWKGAKLKYVPMKANGWQSIFYDLYSMVHALFYADVLLVLGISAGIFIPILKLLWPKKKIILNIDGLEWRRPKWNWAIKKYLMFSERIACKYCDEIITDNRILKAYAKIRYNIDSHLIEYGADHVKKVTITQKDIERYPFLAGEYAFKVARIEPENHLHVILEAFALVPKNKLVIVGNWKNSQYGLDLLESYKDSVNITLLDPIYEQKELDLLRSNAQYYLHGHSAGGTNPSLVEAMYLGLPILSFDVIYNRVTTNNQAIFFSSVEELRQLLLQIDRQPLIAVSEQLKEYAMKRYTWQSICHRYGNLLDGIPVETKPMFKRSQGQRISIQRNKKQKGARIYSHTEKIYAQDGVMF